MHSHIIKTGFRPDIYLVSELVKMYYKCRSMVNAHKAFDANERTRLILRTMMLTGYAKYELLSKAFELYEQMQCKGMKSDRMMYTRIISACASLKNLDKAKAVHSNIIKSGIATDAILESSIVHTYARCGNMKLA